MTNCPDDPDDTSDAVDFVRPKLLAVHFLNHLELHWMEHPIIQHKRLLSLPNALVGHPTQNKTRRKKEIRKSQFASEEKKHIWKFTIFILMSLKSSAVFFCWTGVSHQWVSHNCDAVVRILECPKYIHINATILIALWFWMLAKLCRFSSLLPLFFTHLTWYFIQPDIYSFCWSKSLPRANKIFKHRHRVLSSRCCRSL